MKITLVTAGSRGDVQPYLALGKGLKAAGHEVTILATEDFEQMAAENGLHFHSTGANVQQIIQSDEWRETIEGGNFIRIQMQMTSGRIAWKAAIFWRFRCRCATN